MTDITLDEIRSGYNLSKINNNFTTIEDEINSRILHLSGGSALMQQPIDMNSNKLLNLPAPTSGAEPVRLSDISSLVEITGEFLPSKTGNEGKSLQVNGGTLVYRDLQEVVSSVSELINQTYVTDEVKITSYYPGWEDTVEGPKGSFPVHKTGGTNSSPTVGTAVSVSSIGGGDGTGSTTGQRVQAGYFWGPDGAEWKISDEAFTGGLNVVSLGARGNGGDDSVFIADALSLADHVVIPRGLTFTCKNIPAPSNKKLEVNGTLRLPNGASHLDAIIKQTTVSGFRLTGSGVLDGNRANQSGAIATEAVRLDSASSCVIEGITITSFYGSESAPQIANAISINGGTKNEIRNIELLDWSQEGVVMGDVQYSVISGIRAFDNAGTSWSAVQLSGTTNSHNVISDIVAYNTGASAVGMDSEYSVMTNISIDTVRFQNGVNLGHSGQPSSYSAISNISVKNIQDPSNVNSAGISIVNGTEHVSVSNFVIEGSTQRGINISNLGANIKISNGKILNSVTAINVFQSGSVDISNLDTISCINGINKDSSTVMRLSNVDLTGCSTPFSSSTTGVTAINLDLSSVDPRTGGVSVSSLGAGGTVVVNNANAIASSRIIIEPSNSAAMSALPFISTYSNGSFTVQTVNNGAGGAFLRYQIV